MYAMCDDVRNGEYITWKPCLYTNTPCNIVIIVSCPKENEIMSTFSDYECCTLHSKQRQSSFTRLPQDVRLEDGTDPGQLRRVAQQLLQPGLEGGGGEEREAQQQLLRVNMGEISE